MPATDRENITVAVVILTVNQKDKTLACLESLVRTLPDYAHVLVWDNGSLDGTAETVRQEFPGVVVEHHPRNLGVASGRNSGAQLAVRLFSPTHLLFLDNDMILTDGFVNGLLAPFLDDREGKIGQTQAKLRFMDEPELLNDGGGCRVQFWLGRTSPVGYREVDHGQYDIVRPCICCGGAMMVRADIFEQLGGFDSRFDPFGPEDLDFSLRLQKAGYAALYAPRAVAYHEVSHTTGSNGYTEGYAEHRSRHWLTFMSRHASIWQKTGFYLFGAPLIAVRILWREGRQGNWRALRGLVRGIFRLCGGRAGRAGEQ
jgi:GT2 family glycosyltransferase